VIYGMMYNYTRKIHSKIARGGSRNVEGGTHSVGTYIYMEISDGMRTCADSYTHTQTEQSESETMGMV